MAKYFQMSVYCEQCESNKENIDPCDTLAAKLINLAISSTQSSPSRAPFSEIFTISSSVVTCRTSKRPRDYSNDSDESGVKTKLKCLETVVISDFPMKE